MFQTILTPLTGTDCDDAILALTLRLATIENGHIECVRINPDLNAVAVEIERIGMAGRITLSDRLKELDSEAKERSHAARKTFDAFLRNKQLPQVSGPPGPNSVSACWREETGDEVDRITRLSRYHDAVILAGGKDRTGRMSEEALGAIVMASGRPVFLAPAANLEGPFNTIAIAWNGSPEATRALAAAMPLLHRAKHIELFCVEEPDQKPDEKITSHDSILRYLAWHGLRAAGHFVAPALSTAAEAVLNRVKDLGPDLLVMGAYGHSRLREFVFGGFTRRVLKGVGLPVLLFH